jgi:hypothetical protein
MLLVHPPHETFGEKGICDLVQRLKEDGRKKTRMYHLRKQLEGFEKSKMLEKKSNEIYAYLKQKDIIPNIYLCQKCKRYFCSKEEFKISLNKSPICDICNGKIELDKETVNNIIQQVKLMVEEESGRRR